jgi:hypothetical protein
VPTSPPDRTCRPGQTCQPYRKCLLCQTCRLCHPWRSCQIVYFPYLMLLPSNKKGNWDELGAWCLKLLCKLCETGNSIRQIAVKMESEIASRRTVV